MISFFCCLFLVSLGACLPYIPGSQPRRSSEHTLNPTALVIDLHPRFAAKLPGFARCPNGTHYVIARDRSFLQQISSLTSAGPFPSDDSIYQYRIHGCCQPESIGCFDAAKNNLVGCCPTGSVCCTQGNGHVGCAHSINQCCGSTICPDGYGCCGGKPRTNLDAAASGLSTVCCPLPVGADVNDKTTYCEANTLLSASLQNTTSVWTGCLVSHTSTLPFCDYRGSYSVLAGNNTVDWMEFIDAGLKRKPCYADGFTSPICFNLTHKCRDQSECVYYSEVGPGSQAHPNHFEPAVVQYERVGGCCPVNTTACTTSNAPGYYGGNRETSPFGCADPVLNETCCGTNVCPAGTRCCSINVTRDSLDLSALDLSLGVPETRNYTIHLGCCPVELECCTNFQRDPGNALLGDRFFCGAPFKNVSCARNMYADPFVFQHIHYQLNGNTVSFNSLP